MAMGATCFFLQKSIGEIGDISVLTFCFIASMGIYLLAIMALSGGAKDLREYYSYGWLIFARK